MIPRQFFDRTKSTSGYYNRFAATAESSELYGLSSDSICPSGWGLSSIDNTQDAKSWKRILPLYNITEGDPTNIEELFKAPIMFSKDGTYYGTLGELAQFGFGAYQHTNFQDNPRLGRLFLVPRANYSTEFKTDLSAGASYGNNIRCVKK